MNDKGCITVGVRMAEYLRRELGVAPGEELKLSMEQLSLVLGLGVREGWLRRQEALDSKQRPHVPGRLLVNEAPPAGATPCRLLEVLRATLTAGAEVKVHGEMVETSGIPDGSIR